MKPTKELIRALRETAKRLLTDDSYSWNSHARCNCGILTQVALGLTAHELREAHPDEGSWTYCAHTCINSGLSNDTIFHELLKIGVEPQDFFRIEYLDEYLTNSGKEKNYKKPENVAAWMNARADELEARRASGEKPETCV